MLASCLGEGVTTITNAAREPEIIDLQNFLNKMGAKIRGAGSNKIEVVGVKKLKEISYNIMSDRIEAGTFLCMGAITGGNILLQNVNHTHIIPVIDKLEECGCKLNINENNLEIKAPKRIKATDIKTMPYPGFPTDMQSIFATTLTTAKGTSVIVENIFENRYRYTQELIKMGAKITIEGRTAVIKGVRKLDNAKVKATDLRGGASLVLAALTAKGESIIENVEYILRGYDDFDKKIEALKGKIVLQN